MEMFVVSVGRVTGEELYQHIKKKIISDKKYSVFIEGIAIVSVTDFFMRYQ